MEPQVSEHLAHFVPDGVVLPTAHIQRNRSIRGEVIQQGSTDILMHDKAALVRGKKGEHQSNENAQKCTAPEKNKRNVYRKLLSRLILRVAILGSLQIESPQQGCMVSSVHSSLAFLLLSGLSTTGDIMSKPCAGFLTIPRLPSRYCYLCTTVCMYMHTHDYWTDLSS